MELSELQKYRHRDDLRLDELVDVANTFVQVVAPEQPSDRVAELLNERTLRYYITKGLVDRPIGKEGTAALYGYRHLVQVLVLKRLQASYLPIKRIKEIIAGKSEDELLELLRGAPKEQERDMRKKALSYLNSLITEQPEKEVYLDKSASPARDEYHLNLLSPHSPPIKSEPSKERMPAVDSWERFILEDGVELHVRSDRIANLRGSEVRRVAERILNLLRHKYERKKKKR